MYVGVPGAGKLPFSLRVQDISREAQTWGTSIPIVRELQTFDSTLELLDVPTDARFRVALRVYHFDLTSGRFVRLRIFEEQDVFQSAAPLVDTILELKVRTPDANDSVPGSNAITNLTAAFPQLTAVKKLRILLDPVSAGLRFWALVSITNDETQHVTVIAPNK